MNEGLIKDAHELILKEIQSVLAVFYILLVGIGMLFSYHKYAEFGINIFDYADLLDFLVTPFSDYKIVLFTALSVSAVVFIFYLDSRWKARSPEAYSKMNFGIDKKPWFNLLRVLFFVVFSIVYTYFGALAYADRFEANIRDSEPVTLSFTDAEVITGFEIGKTTDVYFLLKEDQVLVIPLGTNVKTIKLGKLENKSNTSK